MLPKRGANIKTIEFLFRREELDEDDEMETYFNLIVANIRFPMMSPGQLANLLLFTQISKACTDLLVSSQTFKGWTHR